jgi:hypothetical protein
VRLLGTPYDSSEEGLTYIRAMLWPANSPASTARHRPASLRPADGRLRLCRQPGLAGCTRSSTTATG